MSSNNKLQKLELALVCKSNEQKIEQKELFTIKWRVK